MSRLIMKSHRGWLGHCGIGNAVTWGCLVGGLLLAGRPAAAQSIALMAESQADMRMGSLGLGIDAADFHSLAYEPRPAGINASGARATGARPIMSSPEEAAEQAASGLPGMAGRIGSGDIPRGFDPSLARPRIRTTPRVFVPTVPMPVGAAGAGQGIDAARTMPRPMVGPAVGVRPQSYPFPGLVSPKR